MLAASAVASAALFAPLARGHWGDRAARWGALWFGIGSGTLLFTSRLPFAIGVTFGLAALLALQRHRYGWAIVFAVLCPLGSPVAGLFLAMAGVAYAIAERRDRVNRLEGLAIAVAAFLPPMFLAWAFPEGGWAPFPTSAYVPIPLFAIACLLLLPREETALRWGVVLYGLGATLALCDRDADGRQRRPPRRAVRRPRAPVRALGPPLDPPHLGACRSWPWASPRSPSGSGRRRCAT